MREERDAQEIFGCARHVTQRGTRVVHSSAFRKVNPREKGEAHEERVRRDEPNIRKLLSKGNRRGAQAPAGRWPAITPAGRRLLHEVP